MEEREELMVSPSGGEARLRVAHFLKPSGNDAAAAPSPACSAAGLPLKVNYVGWGYHPLNKWKEWVDAMCSSHHSTWKSAGILDAIMSSTCFIHRCEDLILGLVARWSPTTNSFVFPWGEATITLEDMMVLGGYSVLGEDSIFVPRDGESEEKVTKLVGARLDVMHSSGNKRCFQRKWIKQFMGSGDEMEKEAFLALWLFKFVFPFASEAEATTTRVAALAVCLARGTRVALAPAVLASIYRALTLLKNANSVRKKVVVSTPLALVQVWAWERFPALGPIPRWIGRNEPRIARWSGFKHRWFRGMTTLNYGGEDFRWQPYTGAGAAYIYKDDDERVEEWGLNEEPESYVRCVRVSKLVGVDECVELYLPHRVSMQFGMDQDLPGHVDVGGDDLDCIRPITDDAKLYVPPRASQPGISARYFDWWKKLSAMAAVVSEQLQADVDSISTPKQAMKRHSARANSARLTLQVAQHHSWHSRIGCNQPSGGKGSLKRTRRGYLKHYLQRQRNRVKPVPQRALLRCSSARASNTKAAAAFSGKGSSSKCLKRKFVEIDHHNGSPMEATPLSGCETDGYQAQKENCLFLEARNDVDPLVLPSVQTKDKSTQTELVLEELEEDIDLSPSRVQIEHISEAVMVIPYKNINLSPSRAQTERVSEELIARPDERIALSPSRAQTEEASEAVILRPNKSRAQTEEAPESVLVVRPNEKISFSPSRVQIEEASEALIVRPDKKISSSPSQVQIEEASGAVIVRQDKTSLSPSGAQADKASEAVIVVGPDKKIRLSPSPTQAEEASEAVIVVRPDEKIGSNSSQAQSNVALKRWEERSRDLEKIFRMIEAGIFVCFNKGSL